MVRWTLTCDDLAAAGLYDTAACCAHCHAVGLNEDGYWVDERVGWEPPPNGERPDPHVILYPCCGTDSSDAGWHVPLTRTTFARALLAQRAEMWRDEETSP